MSGRAGALARLVGLVLLLAAPLAAQNPPVTRADSLRADSLRADSVRADSQSSTNRLLRVEGQERVRLDPLPLPGIGGLLPAGSRLVFTRDSIDWAAAQTLGDLLARAGLHLWRGGWIGRAEMPNYQARGAAGVEYLQDGVPLVAVGPDSVAVDPSLFALMLLDRVEIERGPGLLRVHLFSRRHDRLAPRTRIGVASGDRSLARYQGAFERRYRSGIGLGLAADYVGVSAPGGSGAANVTNVWLQLGYVPTPRLGAQLQVTLQATARDTLFRFGGSTLASEGLDGTRRDAQLRLFWRDRDDDLGARADLFVGRTTWTGDSLRHDLGSLGVVAGYRRPTFSLDASAWHRTEWLPLDLRAAAGWRPMPRVTAAVEAVHQRYDGARSGLWGTARAGIRLPMSLSLTGVVRHGERVQAPALTDEAAQRFTDVQLLAGFERSWVGVEAGWTRNDAWRPLPYRDFALVPGLAPTPAIQWATLRARVALRSWLTVESVYEHPLQGVVPDGVPPHHALTTGTIRSKFLRNFPSGIFDLKLQGVVESWSPGVIGRDALGGAIALPGRTFVRGIFQLQIGSFIAFYDRANLRAVRAGAVPGYPLPTVASTFGVRWEFAN